MLDSRSTLLNGNHSFPPFYACYLLRSRATVTSRITYIGSTPDPPRRIRQHNGQLTQGALKTSRFRPWEMQMIVYGFPSKLAALQFEYAWQRPEKTRHLREDTTDGQYGLLIKKDRERNMLNRKVAVVCALLALPPFSRLPLHVRFFNEDVQTLFESRRRDQAQGLPLSLSTILDLGGVAGDTGRRVATTPGVTAIDGPIDVEDYHFRDQVWQKLITLTSTPACLICGTQVDMQDHLSYSLCPVGGSCLATTHVDCLGADFVRGQPTLLPSHGQCPGCHEEVQWGEVIRSTYACKELHAAPTLRGTRKRQGQKGAVINSLSSAADLNSQPDPAPEEVNQDSSKPPMPKPKARRKPSRRKPSQAIDHKPGSSSSTGDI
ncbi:hypothetical protein BCR39DRAFT_464113 [Naematelia encephala]|uniref:GIY-YIG domain-containing protein n=1 Tax=Naematelia encephala TaxID=71784 RepID=A0A1Y2BDC1_9TREE|nr:hypothetical protein BCR39DRAFT_464113 [Naematelia encephala]